MKKEFYRRWLPHYQPINGGRIFLTYRLFGSLPQEALERLAVERRLLDNKPVHIGESRRNRALRHGKRLFALTDEALDRTEYGPKWLIIPEIAQMVMENFYHHVERLYYLWAFAIMPNHVHILLEPARQNGELVPLAQITHSLKSYTANQANRILGRKGPFWQDESFDHWARNDEEFYRIVVYIE